MIATTQTRKTEVLKSLTSQQIDHIIRCVDEFNEKDRARVRTNDPRISMKDFEADRKPLVDAVAGISQDARMELMAVMWIGRDFDGSFDDALRYAHEKSDEGDVGYITDKTLGLGTYLRNGRKMVGA